jgi:hypothetical protein
MRAMKLIVPVALLGGFLFFASTSSAKQAYAAKEKKACTFCHAKQEAKEAMAKNLTEAGKYYAAHDHSLDGYKGK